MSEQSTDTQSVYAPPDAELVKDTQGSPNTEYYTVAITKMVVLSILTFNIYNIYWMYKNWQLQKLNTRFDCIPVARAIFQVFFTHSLFASINETAKIKGLDVTWNSTLLATIYIVLLIFSNLTEKLVGDDTSIILLSFLPFIFAVILPLPMIAVQKSVNAINDDPEGKQNDKFNWVNWIFIVLGGSWWVLIIFGVILIMNGEAL